RELREASLAMGATKWQTVKYVVVPKARSGFLSAGLLGLGRVFGETMAVAMLVGNIYRFPSSIFDGWATIPSLLANNYGEMMSVPAYESALMVSALVLLLLVLIFNIIGQRAIKKPDRQNGIKRNGNNIMTGGEEQKKADAIRNIFRCLLNGQGIKKIGKQHEPDMGVISSKSKIPSKGSSPSPYYRITVKAEEYFFLVLMGISASVVIGGFIIITASVLYKGFSSTSLEMLTSPSGTGYLTSGKGGILNAIVGSLLMAGGSTILAFFPSLGAALYLQPEFSNRKTAHLLRTILNILWGVPSIIYGVCCFIIMMWAGLGASLIAGILALTLLQMPIMARGFDEVIRTVPTELKDATYSLGLTSRHAAIGIVLKQIRAGILSSVLLAAGRAIGDAASILFTAGFSNSVPSSFTEPSAALPTMIYFLTTSPDPEVRQKAYAAALVLFLIVFVISAISRWAGRRFEKYALR
ncbi:MAG: ABC transporter permease subunit, partial [Thermoplasmata archaeon]